MRIRDVATNLLNLFIGAVEVILGLRFVLKLFGANSTNGFVSWVYEMSGSLLEPFRSIFPTRVFENQFVIEFSTMFAMIIYAVAGMLLFYLITAITPTPTITSSKKKQ